jgi:DNA-directed RNA polymerase subunit RPC12/RpoP
VARSLSKTVRFEVFKRDHFACQYCGATPPAVVLEVDHIEPVALGGGDDEGNLVTACFDCNRGKAARDLGVTPESLNTRAARVAEAEEQLAGYREIMRAVEARKEADAWEVVEALFGVTETTSARFNSIQSFLKRLDLFEAKDAAQIARAAKPYSELQRFKYFCGVCWRKIERAQDGQD